MADPLIPSRQTLERAHEALKAEIFQTPLIPSAELAAETGARDVRIKAESLQWTGSFKIRGAFWRCLQLSEEQRRAGVVAYSSGNFAQGLAAATQRLNIPCTIVMPSDAPELKRRKTEAFGANVVLSDHGERPREEVAGELAISLAKNKGFTLLHPFDDINIIAGHASAAIEMIRELQTTGHELPDVAICGAGGGGFAAGLAMGFHYFAPGVKLVVVEPEGYDSFGASLANNERTRVRGACGTVCDALQATMPGRAPFACARHVGLAPPMTVQNDHIRKAMRVAFEQLKLVLEPSGAASLAALLEYPATFANQRVVVFATGGNITVADFMHHC